MDISQPLRAGLPGWPGDTPFDAQPVWRHGPGCPVNVARYASSTHAGTHADAPLHYDPDGVAIDAVPLDAFIGPARVLDLRGHGPVIEPASVADRLGGTHPVRILLRTYDTFPHDGWRPDFITLSPRTIAVLAGRGVRLIGIDSPSIDRQDAKILHAHEAARIADIRILEGLVLDDVEAGDYDLIALPLRLAGLDASPVRAVLRPLA